MKQSTTGQKNNILDCARDQKRLLLKETGFEPLYLFL